MADHGHDPNSCVDATAVFLSGIIPDVYEAANWETCETFLAHQESLITYAFGLDLKSPAIAHTLEDVSYYLWRRHGRLQDANSCAERAVEIRKASPDKNGGIDLARSLRAFGNTQYLQGNNDKAKELHQKALAMYRRIYGQDADHPEIAMSLNNLAVDLFQLGNYDEAKELDQKALAMRRRIYGQDADHPEIARSLSNLAIDLYQLGNYDEAKELNVEALAMYRRIYGQDADHPDTPPSKLA